VVEVPPQQKRSCFELRQSATKCISRNQTNRLLACKSDGFFGLTCTVSLRNPWDFVGLREGACLFRLSDWKQSLLCLPDLFPILWC
jgi:hypothetical protein